ncbi:hypothetical protein NSQ29_11410 [Paenibacillus sp. FSL F4-0236]|nr:hypothetical protein [Paenibacillus sp. FSL H7-0737]
MDIKRNNFESIGLLMSKLTIWIYEVLRTTYYSFISPIVPR